jgi:uncharacterized radical SAM superfamily Fe-S cluster-containing enzyme
MQLLEETKSLCPSCMQVISAQIYTEADKVFMQKECPTHGFFKALLWNDYPLYQESFKFANRRVVTPVAECAAPVDKGCPYDCGLCPEHKQHTCLAIFEVTDRCNLNCSVCISSDPKTTEDPTMEQIRYALKELLRCEGGPTPIQFSGGEPTVRHDLADIICIAKDLGFEIIEIDTNGIELAKNPQLAKELADAGLTGIYLSFDGFTTEVYETLKDVDLLLFKEKAIDGAKKAGLEIALAPTIVKGVNDDQLWQIIEYAIKRDLKGVNFQPFAASGRFPQNMFNPMDRFTLPDAINGIVTQSGGQLKLEDFIFMPCQDNRCATLTYLIIKKDKIQPLNRMVETGKMLRHYADSAGFDEVLDTTKEMLCETSTSKGSCCSASLDMLQGQYFTIGCHGLQDIWTFDLNRIRKCCVHELTVEGTLVPFCLYSITNQNGENLYRGRESKNLK